MSLPSFQSPWLLLLLLALPAILVLRRVRGRPAVRFAPGGLAAGLPSTWRARLRFLPLALVFAGTALGILALARPVRFVPVPETGEGIDILLLIDTSSSMAANDLDPERSRLEVARDAAARFIAGRPDDRIGLIRFARYPDLECPPTPDHGALREILAGVTLVSADGPEDATGIGAAVARAAQVLQAAPASRVVILLTDGEENVATENQAEEIAPRHAARLAAELGVKVYTVVVGLGGRDQSGRFVPLDTDEVRRLAERTGGRYFEAREAGAVAGVYGEIDALEKTEIPEPRYRAEERFLPFLAAALALLVLGRLFEARPLVVLP